MTIPPPPYGAYPPPPLRGYPAALRRHPHPQPQPTNALAIVSLVCAFLFAPLGIVFGHISLSQIKHTGEEGRGLAIAGLVISYLITVLSILVVVLSVLVHRRRSPADLEYAGRSDSPSTRTATATPSPRPTPTLPAFKPPATLGLQLPISGHHGTGEQARQAAAAPAGCRPTPRRSAPASTTNRGSIGLQLDNGKAPCTVNNFVSLARQRFFDDTTCHRLTTSADARGAAVRRPDRHRDRRSRLPIPRTSTRPTSSGCPTRS